MSVEALALVLHHSKARDRDKLVLLGIANHDGDGGAWPTVATLAKYANASERSVQRSLKVLANDLNELRIHRQGGGTNDMRAWERPNRYDVLVKCPGTCDGTKHHRDQAAAAERGYPQAHRGDRASPVPSGSDRVTHLSPGDTSVTSPGDTSVTQTVHGTPVERKVSTDVTGPRAGHHTPTSIKRQLCEQNFSAKAEPHQERAS